MASKVKTPKGWTINKKSGQASYKISFNFDSRLASRLNANFDKAQRYVDSEVLRLSEPYIPRLTGTLINSGYSSTSIGTGKVVWETPYARRRHFEAGKNQTGIRGPHWVKRMMNNRGQEIVKGVEKIVK